jgi:hypothetical protein
VTACGETEAVIFGDVRYLHPHARQNSTPLLSPLFEACSSA